MASGYVFLILSMADSTEELLLPLMMTWAPSEAKDLAISKPMPPDEAVTSAVLFSNSNNYVT